MKKTIAFFLILAIVLSFSAYAFAESSSPFEFGYVPQGQSISDILIRSVPEASTDLIQTFQMTSISLHVSGIRMRSSSPVTVKMLQ